MSRLYVAFQSPRILIKILFVRLRSSDQVREEVSRLVRLSPTLVSHVPAALQYLANPSNIEADIPEVLFSSLWFQSYQIRISFSYDFFFVTKSYYFISGFISFVTSCL